MQEGDKAYLRLFECMDRSQVYSQDIEDELAKSFSSNSIEIARKHLYHVIMRSLRLYEADKSIEVRLMNLIQDSQILFNRGLVEASYKQIEKAKNLAVESEKYLFFVMSARQELRFAMREQFWGWDETILIDKHNEIDQHLNLESSVHQHSSMYELLQLRYWKRGKVRSLLESSHINDLLLMEHQIINNHLSHSFESQQLHLYFQSTYFLMTDHLDSALKELYDLNRLFLENTHLWSDRPQYYIQMLFGILQTLRGTQRFEEMEYYFSQLRSVKSISNSIKLNIHYQILEHQLHFAITKEDKSKIIKLLEEKNDTVGLEKNELAIQLQVQIELTRVRAYFKLKEYSKSLVLINDLLNQTSRSINHLLYISCRLMNLLIHHAMNNKDYIYYEIRSVERKLKKEKKWYKTEQFVLQVLKNWIQNKSLKSFHEQSQKLLEDPLERQLIQEVGLKSWFDSIFMYNK
jgi:hypothetical protein